MPSLRPIILLIALLGLQPQQANAGAPGQVVPTGSMTVARHSAVSVLLPSGKVLVAGGMLANGVFLRSAELYDPATATFSKTADMSSERGYGASATRLNDGTVLLAGGRAESACTASAERYDERRRTFLPAGTMHVTRCGGFAILMPSGNVLIVGGDQPGANDVHTVTSVEVYDPKADRFSLHGSTTGDANAAVLLKNGLVLVVHEATAELYDPTTGLFSDAGTLLTPRHKTGAAILPDGRAVLFGGQIGDTWGPNTRSTEIFDPVTRHFSRGPEMLSTRYKLRATVIALQAGRYLIAGGAERPEILDAGADRFIATTGARIDSYYFSSATNLADGNVLIAGGYGKDYTSRTHAWLYKP